MALSEYKSNRPGAHALEFVRPRRCPAVGLSIKQKADRLEINVRDYGPGIPSEQAQHLGEPFFRGDPSRTRGTGESGLGLYLAKLVAEAHGGQLLLRDEIKDGASFDVILPLNRGRTRSSQQAA